MGKALFQNGKSFKRPRQRENEGWGETERFY